MKFINPIFLMACLLLCMSGCSSEDTNIISFRIYNSDTGEPLSNATISIYDGFDVSLPPFGGPVKSDNSRYHFGDKKTTSNGFLKIDLARFKNNTILLQVGKDYKYIDHNNKQITVVHYQRKDLSLHVVAHYIYNLETKMVTIIRFPDKLKETPKTFTHIDIPLD